MMKPVLAAPDLDKEFRVEADADGNQRELITRQR